MGLRPEQKLDFMNHLMEWVKQQPEYPILLAMPRRERKDVAELIADALVKIPLSDGKGKAVLLEQDGLVTVVYMNRKDRRSKLVTPTPTLP